MLIKSLCRIIIKLLLCIPNISLSWGHQVLPTQSSQALVEILPAQNVVYDNQELTEEASEGGRDHYNSPHSIHLAFEELLWAGEMHGLFCEDERKDQ